MSMWIPDAMRDMAKRVDLIKFMKEKHPSLIIEREAGTYVFSKRTCLTIFKGRDGFYHYCDHAMKNKNEFGYSGDSITFLIKYVGYSYESAIRALLEYNKNWIY